MRVLIADDDPILSRLLDYTLSRLGHETVMVTNGPSAIETLLDPDGPQLAILDWTMPGATGPEVCVEIRKRATHYVYIILLTARDGRDDMVTGLESGADDFLTKPFDAVELRSRVQSGTRVLDLQQRLLQAHDLLRIQASRDDLTGLKNRRASTESLESESQRAKREKRALCVAMADVDNFKEINDRYGHPAGDAVLRHVAAAIQTGIRSYDTIGRYGGEEFLFVWPGSDREEGIQLANRLCAQIASETVRWEDKEIPVTLSFGIAATPDGTTDVETLIRNADAALYRAKAEGRNRVKY